MNWRMMKLGALLTQSKVPSVAADANRRIRVKLNVGGVEKRPVSNEVEGATNYYTRRAGQFIFGTQNFHKGAFGVIPPELDGFETSNDIPSFDVSKDCLPEWIFFYFKVGDRYKELEKLARGVGSKRVHPKQIFEIEIPVPPVAEQLVIIEQVQASAARQRMIVEETDQQLTHLTQLRQALLREAMQGQLLPQDPTDEPAAVLLMKLQAAKATAGKAGKRKGGPLFAEETTGPHELPVGWSWCVLSDLAAVITKGSSPSWQGVKYVDKSNNGMLFITSKNVGSYKLILDKLDYVEQRFNEIEPRSILKKGDLLTNIVGASIGRTAIYDLDEVANINQAVCLIRLSGDFVSKEYLLHYFNSDFALALIAESQFAPGRANLSMSNISQFPVPIPPYAEQLRIVAKMEQLMQHCDALEQRIRESRWLAEQLLQTALREALAPPAGAPAPAVAELEVAQVSAGPPRARRTTARGSQLTLGGLLD